MWSLCKVLKKWEVYWFHFVPQNGFSNIFITGSEKCLLIFAGHILTLLTMQWGSDTFSVCCFWYIFSAPFGESATHLSLAILVLCMSWQSLNFLSPSKVSLIWIHDVFFFFFLNKVCFLQHALKPQACNSMENLKSISWKFPKSFHERFSWGILEILGVLLPST